MLGPEDLFVPPPAASRREILRGGGRIIALAFALWRLCLHDGRARLDRCRPILNRRTWGLCTSLPEPVELRVFITYAGTMDNVITLALPRAPARLAQLAHPET